MSLDEALKDQSPNYTVLIGHHNPIVLGKLSLDEGDKLQEHQEEPKEVLAAKVLLSIFLCDDTLSVVEDLVQWLSSFHPLQVTGVEMEDVREAAFSSGSMLLLLSMPVSIWARLRPHPAYTFVGFIKSSPERQGLCIEDKHIPG